MDSYQEQIESVASALRERIETKPRVGIVCGSGLGDIAGLVADPVVVPYADIPGMTHATAPGHRGNFVCGTLAGVGVVCMQGRLHSYEGHSARAIALPIRAMGALGIEAVIATNAAGAIDTTLRPGDIVAVSDHINFLGVNPMTGDPGQGITPMWFDMTDAYSPRLRGIAHEVADGIGLELHEGVYIACQGPSFETPAEIRAFRTWGADLVGMSTVLETTAARACGMEVCAFSLVTNMAAGISKTPLAGAEMIEIGTTRGPVMQALAEGVVTRALGGLRAPPARTP